MKLNTKHKRSIAYNGSLRGMYKIYGWKSENIIKCGSYYYHVTDIDDKRILGLI